MAKYNWAEKGITWASEKVARRAGKNASDKTFYPSEGQILIVSKEDLPKFLAEQPQHMTAVVSHLDGQSFRVASQRVSRAHFEKGGKVGTPAELEDLRNKIYESVILGSRIASVATITKVEKVYKLPNGSEYTGKDEVEFRQSYIAALVDLGVEVSQAQLIASGISF